MIKTKDVPCMNEKDIGWYVMRTSWIAVYLDAAVKVTFTIKIAAIIKLQRVTSKKWKSKKKKKINTGKCWKAYSFFDAIRCTVILLFSLIPEKLFLELFLWL